MIKRVTKISVFLACLAVFNLITTPVVKVTAQNVLATINFDPKTDGFGFENYGNDKRTWQNDLTAEDMIRLFGAKAVCASGDAAGNCVLKAAAQEWMNKMLKDMNGGHCEGMAVAVARMKFNKPFKTRDGSPASFQPGASRVFDLKLNEPLGNYIAYYWITQTFDEVASPSKELSKNGPVAVINAFVEGVKSGKDNYTLGFEKYDRATGKKSDGHAVTPIAVEDAGDKFILKIYDNNYPGEFRDISVEKAGKQTWKYITTTKPGEPVSEYSGDLDTKTLDLVPNSNRDKTCFEAPFAGQNAEKQCPAATAANFSGSFDGTNASGFNEFFLVKNDEMPIVPDIPGDRAQFFVNNDSDLLVTTSDGKRLGFDPVTNRFYEEINGGRAIAARGGRGENLPSYTIPANTSDRAYKVTFSGKELKEESTTDFVYSAPGLTVGFDGIRLDPNETLTTTITPDGETITFTSSADGETPGIYFAFDPQDGSGDSFIVRIGGAQIEAGKTLTAHFDFENHKVSFKDNDGNGDEYEVEVERIKPDGTRKRLKKEFKEGGNEVETYLDDWSN